MTRVAVVTGAAGGLGAAIVRSLATCRTDYLTGAVLTLDGGLSVG